jgi:hypothetical protein
MNHVEEKYGGWIFWDETWADYHGPFKTEEGANEALQIYCKTYLDNVHPREPNIEEMKRWKELLIDKDN